MTRIRVNPDDLREIARQFSQTADALYRLYEHLSAVWERLNADGWERAHRGLVEPQWWRARSRLNDLADQADELAGFLIERAARFEEADHIGVSAVEQMSVAFAEVQRDWAHWFRSLQPVLYFPHALARRVLRLGGREITISITLVTANSAGDGRSVNAASSHDG